jgi:hypothetical protein
MPINFDKDRSPFLVKKDSNDRVKKLAATGDRGGEIMGSIQQTKDGKSFLVAGSNISIVSESNGQVTISSTGGGTSNSSVITLDPEPSLIGSRMFVAGTGLLLDDAGPNSTATVSINDSQVATVSGTRFANNVTVVGTGTFEFGVSGSLTRLSDGKSYLVASSGISITSESNGQITISSQGGASDKHATYLVLSTTGSLTNERALTPGTGLLLVDAGPNSTATLSINDSQVATVSGTRFTGVVAGVAGFSGSLTRLVDGTPYITSSQGITATTSSIGQIQLSSTSELQPAMMNEMLAVPPYMAANSIPAQSSILLSSSYIACLEVPFAGTIDRLVVRLGPANMNLGFGFYQLASGAPVPEKDTDPIPLVTSGSLVINIGAITNETITLTQAYIRRGFLWIAINVMGASTSVLSNVQATTSVYYDSDVSINVKPFTLRKSITSAVVDSTLTLTDYTLTSTLFPVVRLYKA